MAMVPVSGASVSEAGVETPSEYDVICGRGQMTSEHRGNRRFKLLVDSRKGDYQRSTRREDKTRITNELVEEIKSGRNGGRFLLFDTGSHLWFGVSDEYAREKVGHALRSRSEESSQQRSSASLAKKAKRKAATQGPAVQPCIDKLADKLIQEQQILLNALIESET